MLTVAFVLLAGAASAAPISSVDNKLAALAEKINVGTHGRHPVTDCSSLVHAALGTNVTVTSAALTHTSQESPNVDVQFCLVKVLVQPAINIWVGLPSVCSLRCQRATAPAEVLGGFESLSGRLVQW
jgi:hypothetical protein